MTVFAETIFHALVLGIVQGITEFLPISSTGHLVVIPKLLGWSEQPFVFDTTLHLATAAALLIFFWKDLYRIIVSFISALFKFKFSFKNYPEDARLGLYILAGSLPAGILGLVLGDFIESTFRSVLYVAFFILLGSFLMLIAEKLQHITNTSMDLKRSSIIGVFQALALFPGFSRSGATISGGMLMGLDREKATRFSFLLSIPIVVVAGLFELLKTQSSGTSLPFIALFVGFISALFAGIVSIKVLLNFVRGHTLYPFIIYRVILFAVILLISL